MNYIEQAYNESNFFIDKKDISYIIYRPENTSNFVSNKIEDSLKKCFLFWNNYIEKDIDLIVLYSDERSYDWLYDKLKDHHFQDAMPKKDRIDSIGDVGLTGGGGMVLIDDKEKLFFWQVVGSKSTYSRTGEIKTPPHLFAHAVQSLISSRSNKKVTDLPPWFVEGQSDYSALLCISDSFNEFNHHRNNFIKDCYVPGLKSKLMLKNFSSSDWFRSLNNCSVPFEGIPLVDEYYSGFFCYEQLILLLGMSKIKDLFTRSLSGENFDDVFYELSQISIEDFLIDMSKIIEKESKKITG